MESIIEALKIIMKYDKNAICESEIFISIDVNRITKEDQLKLNNLGFDIYTDGISNI